MQYFVSLRDAQAALRATWSMASTHWGVAVQPEDERPAESLPTWGTCQPLPRPIPALRCNLSVPLKRLHLLFTAFQPKRRADVCTNY